jgi:hypothetical protein
MTHFGHFAKMFAFLAEYRGHLMAEAESKGWPLMRHMVRKFYGNTTAILSQ